MTERISPEEALDLMEDEGHLYVDVRSVNEFEGGHPEGAYNVPLKHMMPGGMQDNADFLAVMEASFAKDQPLILGCRSGNRSLMAAGILEEAGYERVIDQRAGWVGTKDAFGTTVEAGWQAAGLPITLEPEEGRDYASLAAKAGKEGV